MLIAKKIHQNLNESIGAIVANKENYVKNPRKDFTRKRKLSMNSTIRELLSMGGESLPKEMIKYSDINHVDITPSAFIQQRDKISPSALNDLFYKFNDLCKDSQTYRGYRLLAVDGSDIDCYRNKDSLNFAATPTTPKGFNKVHLNALYDVLNKTYVDVLLQPYLKQDEQGALIKMLNNRRFDAKTLIISDRGYEGYNTIMHLYRANNVDFICRVKHGTGGFRCIAKLPMMELDIDVSDEITTTQKNEDKARNRIYLQIKSKKDKISSPKTRIARWDFESPCAFTFRVVCFMLETGEYETVITSLNRNHFPASEIKKLYHMRWGIETSFRQLKYNVGLVNLHSKKDVFVEQEIYAALTMYNYCSRIVAAIPAENRQKTKHCYAIDYSVAVLICKQFIRKQNNNFIELIKRIAKHVVPIRPGRKDERNIKKKGFVGFTYRVAA